MPVSWLARGSGMLNHLPRRVLPTESSLPRARAASQHELVSNSSALPA
jgi:hypothetical protein